MLMLVSCSCDYCNVNVNAGQDQCWDNIRPSAAANALSRLVSLFLVAVNLLEMRCRCQYENALMGMGILDVNISTAQLLIKTPRIILTVLIQTNNCHYCGLLVSAVACWAPILGYRCIK
jgi:hypothetical protein